MVQFSAAATVTVAVVLAASAYAAPVQGTDVDISARSEHSHTHAHGAHHQHHATRDLDNVEELDARFIKHIARKIFGRDLSSVEGELEARTHSNKIDNREMRRELQDSEELEARFFKRIARKIFGREFDDVEELEARHEHTSGHHHQSHHHQHKVVERALEGMSDEELQARAPIFRRIARKIFGRDLTEEDLLEARSPFFRKIAKTIFGRDLEEEDLEARSPFFRKIAKTIFGRELEEDLEVEARGLMMPGRRYPIGWRGAVRPRDIEFEDSFEARSIEELD